MFTRILTDNERKHIQKYLRQNGRKEATVRKVVYGAKRHLPKIRADLNLIETLLSQYGRSQRER